MGVLAEKYRPGDIERTSRELWAARGLPRPDGVIGRSTSPIVHQFEGALITGDDPGLVVFRAVAADVDARYLSLAGRRALGTLHKYGELDEPAVSLLRALSVWTGGASGSPVDSVDRRSAVETILGRMAALGLVATRDTALRVCPSCGQARSPERIIYQQEDGDAYLIRFPLPEGDGVVHALAWVDAPWRLLGASALLVSPTLPYVVARYRRRGVEEKILTSRPSLARLLEWLPGGEVEVLEEGSGARWAGRVYQYPLRHEFPMGGELTPPSGTVLAVSDVSDSGTGIVPLVPGHGGTDAQIADRLGISGWPLVTPRGQLSFTLAHKYSGLDIPTANEFVARDLSEGGAVFARLRVRRGVPHCSICGAAMVWAPGRAWCLEPSRLPAERRDLYRRLLPKEPSVGQVEVAAWPVSEAQSAGAGPFTVNLLECPGCERLAPLGSGPECPCGLRRNPVGRRLLPSIAGVLGSWARFDPFPAGDSSWLYLNERRRAPALVHHLAAMAGVVGVPNDVGLTLLPGVPEGGVAELVGSVGADAVRAALVRGEQKERSGPTFPDRCRQEARQLERWWYIARELTERCDPALLATFGQSISGSLGELEVEDRAILARWERARLAVLADYDHQAGGAAHRRLTTFLSNDLETYMSRVRPRLDRSGTPPSRRAALRTLHHVLREVAVVLAPVSPHIAEVVYSALVPGRTSVFEANVDPLDSSLLDEAAIKAWDRWSSIERAVARFRRRVGIDPTTSIPALTALVASDELAASLRTDRPTVQRLTRVTRFEAFGPSTPWPGRQRSLEPVLAEIQKAYPQEAGQILHVLRRLPVRHRGDAGTSEELSVVVRGTTLKILPSMVEYVETLPERVVAMPWPLGELYAELPGPQTVPSRNPPPVSPDAFRLLNRVERELRRTGRTESGGRGPIVVAALDPLAAELQASAKALATYLAVSEVRVVDPAVDFPRANCLFGRTRTGVHWWVRCSDQPVRPPHTKHRVPRSRLARVRSRRPGLASSTVEIDYGAEEEIAKEELIRSLVQELDGVLGAPLLGPAKVSGAWAAGFHSIGDFSRAPFDRIDKLPGFGGPIAESLVRKLGGTVPVRPRRPTYSSGPVPAEVAVVADLPELSGTIAYLEVHDLRSSVRPTPSPTLVPLATSTPSRVPREPPAPPTPLPSMSPSEPDPARAIEPVPLGRTEPLGGAEPGPTQEPTVASMGPAPDVRPTDEPVLPRSDANPVDPRPTEWSASPTNPVGDPPRDGTSDSPVPAPDNPPLPDSRGAPSADPDPTPPPTSDSPAEPPPVELVPVEALLVAPAAFPESEGGQESLPESPAPRESSPEEPDEVGPGEVPGALPDPGREETNPSALDPIESPREVNPAGRDDGEREVHATAADDRGGELPSAGGPPSDSRAGVEPEPSRTAGADDPLDLEPSEESTTPDGGGAVDLPDSSLPEPLGATELPPEAPTPETPPGELPILPEADAVADPSNRPDVPQEAEDGSSTRVVPEGPGTPEPSTAGGVPATPPQGVSPAAPPTDEGAESPVLAPEESVVGEVVPQPIPEVGDPTAEVSPALPTEPESVLSTPGAPPVPLPPPPPTGGITLSVAPSLLPAFTKFLDSTAAGHRGVCIVRESPDRLRAHVGPRPVEIYWLTNIGRGLTLRPNDLDGYATFLHKAVDQDRVTAFFLEGIEYLTRVHGTERVIERLAAFHVEAQAHDARVWVYLHPDLIPAADLALFTAAFGDGLASE
jgi:hypothetical protein